MDSGIKQATHEANFGAYHSVTAGITARIAVVEVRVGVDGGCWHLLGATGADTRCWQTKAPQTDVSFPSRAAFGQHLARLCRYVKHFTCARKKWTQNILMAKIREISA